MLRETKVGILFIAGLAILIWGYNFLKGTDLLKKEQIYHSVYDNIEGLEKSNNVMIHGLKIGQVKDIFFEENYSGRIIVILSVTAKFPIPKNSVAKIYSSDLMGSKEIEIVLGDSQQLAQNGDTLFSAIEGSLKDEVNRQVQPLKVKAENLLGSLDSVVTIFQTIFNENARDNLAKSFSDIQKTFYNLQHTSTKLDSFIVVETNRLALVIENIESISRNLNENEENITNILKNFSAISDSIAKANITSTIVNTGRTANQLAILLEKANKGEGSLGKLLSNDTLYYQVEKTASDLNKLLEDIKKHPKRYVKFSLF